MILNLVVIAEPGGRGYCGPRPQISSELEVRGVNSRSQVVEAFPLVAPIFSPLLPGHFFGPFWPPDPPLLP